jgi:hypothetical protein
MFWIFTAIVAAVEIAYAVANGIVIELLIWGAVFLVGAYLYHEHREGIRRDVRKAIDDSRH